MRRRPWKEQNRTTEKTCCRRCVLYRDGDSLNCRAVPCSLVGKVGLGWGAQPSGRRSIPFVGLSSSTSSCLPADDVAPQAASHIHRQLEAEATGVFAPSHRRTVSPSHLLVLSPCPTRCDVTWTKHEAERAGRARLSRREVPGSSCRRRGSRPVWEGGRENKMGSIAGGEVGTKEGEQAFFAV